jgi:glycine cleavage system H protein
MEFPSDLKYIDSDEWIRIEDDIATVGVTDFAQDQLSDIVYFEITVSVGDHLATGDAFAILESVKAAADIYAPVSGEAIETNEGLANAPEQVNTDPYGEAWMVRIRMTDPAEADALLDAETYRKSAEERSA